MAVGSFAGVRVARTLGSKVLKMTHVEGFTANLTTAGLVGAGALLALPMSTTQVSTGAIVGSAGGQLSRLSGKTLRDFAIAWTASGLGAHVATLVLTAGLLPPVLLTLVGGTAADRIDPRTLIMLGCGLRVVSFGLLATVTSPAGIIGATALTGVAAILVARTTATASGSSRCSTSVPGCRLLAC